LTNGNENDERNCTMASKFRAFMLSVMSVFGIYLSCCHANGLRRISEQKMRERRGGLSTCAYVYSNSEWVCKITGDPSCFPGMPPPPGVTCSQLVCPYDCTRAGYLMASWWYFQENVAVLNCPDVPKSTCKPNPGTPNCICDPSAPIMQACDDFFRAICGAL
jgi:hypothetical protein